MKKSFLNHGKPWMCASIHGETPEEDIELINRSFEQGADSFCIVLSYMHCEYWTEENVRKIFAACKEAPVYSCCYRTHQGQGHSDEELAEMAVLSAKCGSTLVDIMGDIFHPEPWELTYDEEAVRKQRALIKEIHDLGAEVLMSSHNHAHYSAEQIVEWMAAQQERGVDVCKDINAAETEEELIDVIRTHELIHEKIKVPYLYMAGGSQGNLSRFVGGRLGCFMYLGRTSEEGFQPKLSTLKFLSDHMDLSFE